MPDTSTLNVTDPQQLTEAAAAAEFARRYSGGLKYNHTTSKWLQFVEGRWAECSTGEEQRAAKELATAYAQAATNSLGITGSREAFAFAKRLASTNGVTSLLKLAQSEKSLAVETQQFDTNTRLFNVKNGTIELAPRGTTGAPTHQLRRAQPDDLLALQANVKYDAAATCPQFEAFIDETFEGDGASIEYVRRLLGSCLAGGNDEQVFPICWGSGANGKSTLLNLVRDIFGDYGQTLSGDALAVKRAGAITNDIADLKAVRLAIAPELPTKPDTNLVKRLTGGDQVRGRRLFQNNEEFTPEVTVIASTNTKPTLPAGDDAVWRRVHLIPFKHIVSPEDRDTDLPQKLLAEAPGVLNWLLRGYAHYVQRGLAAPDTVMAATSAFRDELDLVKRFVEDMCDVNPASKEGAAAVQDAFKHWCETNGEPPVRASQLKERLASLGYEQTRIAGGNKYMGLRLRPTAELGSFERAA